MSKKSVSIFLVFLSLMVFMATLSLANPAANAALLPSGTPLAISTSSPEIQAEQARLLYRANRITAALNIVNSLIESAEPDASDSGVLFRAYFLRGQLYQSMRDYDAAIQDFSQAIALQPDIAEAYKFRADTYFVQQQYLAAVDDYTQAIEYDNSEPAYYLARGLAYIGLDESDDALADFDAALALDPEMADVYRERGFLYQILGENELALADLSTYLELNPEASDASQIQQEITALQSP